VLRIPGQSPDAQLARGPAPAHSGRRAPCAVPRKKVSRPAGGLSLAQGMGRPARAAQVFDQRRKHAGPFRGFVFVELKGVRF